MPDPLGYAVRKRVGKGRFGDQVYIWRYQRESILTLCGDMGQFFFFRGREGGEGEGRGGEIVIVEVEGCCDGGKVHAEARGKDG